MCVLWRADKRTCARGPSLGPATLPGVQMRAACPRRRPPAPQVLQYGAKSANIITEEPIDMVLHESYPNR